MREDPRIKTVTLDRVTVYTQQVVEAELMHHISADERMKLLEYEDAYARRHILRMFGKTVRTECRSPATWWQHLKLALRTRWPRLFRRLRVEYHVEGFDSGAVVTGLQHQIGARHMVIPYALPVEWRTERE